MRKHHYTLYLILLCPCLAWAQIDSIQYSYQDAIESAVAASEDAPFDYDTEFEHLADFIRHPLSINKASATDFAQLRLLSSGQIMAIIQHRMKYGFYISLHELQSVLDLATIRKILPFLRVEGTLDDFQIPLHDWFIKGKYDLFARWERRLEKAEGYKRANMEGYLGDRNRLYTRFRYTFGNRLSYGLTIEKDAGEPFGKSAFDFWSFHFKINNLHKLLKTIVFGDFTINLGQGLIHDNGFNISKSALVLSIEKATLPVRQYTSSNEANFMRGIATHLQISQNTEGVIFASYRRRDANLEVSTDPTDEEAIVSALQVSGLHRKESEIDDRNAVGLLTLGGRLKRDFKRGSIGLNTVFNSFDRRLDPRNEPYNFYSFRGRQLLNASVDYVYRFPNLFQNFHIFGETAMSDNGGFATLNGLLLGLDKRFSFSILQRMFSLKYQALQAQPFAESSRVQDENGFYIGMEFKPHRRWTVSSYADFWRHQWWRFRVDAPSQGAEYFMKIAFRQRYTEGYLQMRVKTKPQNATDRPDALKVNEVVGKTKTQIRLHFNNRLMRQIELRNRLEWTVFNDKTAVSRGFAMWQDILLSFDDMPSRRASTGNDLPHSKNMRQPIFSKIREILRGSTWTSRLAYFDTNDYNSAIYAFENDLLYNFTVVPYYFRGSRFYLNANFRLWKNAYLEARFARTFLSNKKSFGDGLDRIDGQTRSDVKVQLRVLL